ncbi:hypothetical protein [Dinoroseobacter sp. S375]|uniref:hypothetical protein n=1 Tax=Dinoroseobacter sp. S375 TaxID=3415136 RepID=UPI003C7C21A0
MTDSVSPEVVSRLETFLSEPWWAGLGVVLSVAMPLAMWLFFKLRRASNTPSSALAAPNSTDPSAVSRFPAIAIHTDRKVIGRDADLEKLRTVLASGKGAQITSAGAVLKGEGGRGKTTLARYYAERMGPSYDGGCWVPAQTREGVFDALATFGTLAFDLPAPEPVGAAHVHAVLDKIQNSNARLLFVFDNVHGTEMKTAEEGTFTYADLRAFLPKGRKIHLILTTRAGSGFDGFDTIPLDVLAYDAPDSAAVDLLLQEAGQADADAETRVVAQGLAAELGGLPLALTIAGALAREGASFPELAERMGEILATDLPNGDYPDSIAAAVQLSLAGLSADARALLDVAAWWAPDGVSARLFTDAPQGDWWEDDKDVIPEMIQALVKDPARVRASLRALRNRSLIRGDEVSFSLHRLTAAVVRAGNVENGWPMAQTSAALLAACYPGGESPQNSNYWPVCRRLTPHALALWDIAEDLWKGAWVHPDWAPMQALLNQCGSFLLSQEDKDAALLCARGGSMLTTRRSGEEDRGVAVALGSEALMLARLGSFEEAENKLSRAVRLDEKYRPHSADLAARYSQRADLEIMRYQIDKCGDLLAAERSLTQAREIIEVIGSAEQASQLWNKLATLRRMQGRFKESADAFELTLSISRRVSKSNPFYIATDARNAGSTRLEAGQVTSAETLLREAYQIHSEIFASRPDHQDLKNSAGWLTSCLLTRARAGDDPEGRHREAQEICARHGLDFAECETIAAKYPISPAD